ncbi:MAG: CRISPR-associated endoribonuclease Cas6 [Clostridia bacterium]|nr:CRISPR-associated endoribonuclease Cas6 [Clostridia bacterium]
MRIELKLNAMGKNIIDFNYNHSINTLLDDIMKDVDYIDDMSDYDVEMFNGTKLGLFNFSRLLFRKYNVTAAGIEFDGYARLYISSPFERVIQGIIEGLSKRQQIEINGIHFCIENISERKVFLTEKEDFKMLCPTVVPLMRDGRLIFLNPLQSLFYEVLKEITAFKCKHIYKKEFDYDFFNIGVINPEKYSMQKSENLICYDEQYIKGYLFPVYIEAPVHIMSLIYDSGLGGYNSQGFGMLEKIGR